MKSHTHTQTNTNTHEVLYLVCNSKHEPKSDHVTAHANTAGTPHWCPPSRPGSSPSAAATLLQAPLPPVAAPVETLVEAPGATGPGCSCLPLQRKQKPPQTPPPPPRAWLPQGASSARTARSWTCAWPRGAALGTPQRRGWVAPRVLSARLRTAEQFSVEQPRAWRPLAWWPMAWRLKARAAQGGWPLRFRSSRPAPWCSWRLDAAVTAAAFPHVPISRCCIFYF